MWAGFWCSSCKIFGLACRIWVPQHCSLDNNQSLIVQWFNWQPVVMTISIVVAVSVAIFLIAYFSSTVLNLLHQK